MPKVSVTIITLNEADHIAAAIDSAAWADEIVVVDSGSTDDTVAIARSKGVRVETRAWSGYVDQKNFAHILASHDWIFSLDADERITPALAARSTRCSRANHRAKAIACLGWRTTSDAGSGRRTSIRTIRPDCTTAGVSAVDRMLRPRVGKRGRRSGQLVTNFSTTRFATCAISSLASITTRRSPRGRCTSVVSAPARWASSCTRRRRSYATTASSRVPRRHGRSHDLAVNSCSVFLKFAKLWELQNNSRLPTHQLPTTTNSQFSTLIVWEFLGELGVGIGWRLEVGSWELS